MASEYAENDAAAARTSSALPPAPAKPPRLTPMTAIPASETTNPAHVQRLAFSP
ncbi:MAG: hypothetical protein U1E29_06410 [Coriobacteriia bacterium]|nr:hypothetical protein [Coriobacteriia bacterium]